jgi:hypothetical protein
MMPDLRESIIGCRALNCINNIKAIEETCNLKMILLDEMGRCKMCRPRPVPAGAAAGMMIGTPTDLQPGPDGKIHIRDQQQIPPGTVFRHPVVIDRGPHFEKGVWVE